MINVCVIGLGYVGLPLCLTISKKFQTIGFDINKSRINNLNKKKDVNNEFKRSEFDNRKISFTSNILDIKKSNFYIICVPTPITNKKIPDLKPIKKSFETIARVLKSGDIVVLESTVYPGVTSNFTNFLEKKTKLKNNKDFFVCYSPERINPGDKKNNLTNINKIIALNTKNKNIILKVKNIYKNFCKKLIFLKNIKETETAKIIENIQRDLNISLFNEILMICDKLKLDYSEVVRLAKTKWNFINFQPGLVGGHCLPVDPYYLSYIAKENKFDSIVTLAGRKTNNKMEQFVFKKFIDFIKLNNKNLKSSKILVVGLTYKYGVSDMRNSLNLKIYNKIKKITKETHAYDPFSNESNLIINKNLSDFTKFDVVLFLTNGSIFQKVHKRIL
mgnify:CR=1 FL=1